jgi:secreted trypsin-like serine protease
VIGHKGYDVDTFKNDVAILKLDSPVPLDHPIVQPIPLSGILAENRVNESCQISGWGTLEYSEDSPTASPWLVAANISINSKAKCNQKESHAGTVGKGMFCAGPFEGGKDSCQGDSGGKNELKVKNCMKKYLNFLRSPNMSWIHCWHHKPWLRLWTAKISWNLHGCCLL